MKITEVTETELPLAGAVHVASWRESHKDICQPDFVALHTPQRQTEYLREQIRQGKKLFLLTEGVPLGVVSVAGDLIENLYVLPEKQRQGYGTRLLLHAIGCCNASPRLWVLSTNQKAIALYTKYGFAPTGGRKQLSAEIDEFEMKKDL